MDCVFCCMFQKSTSSFEVLQRWMPVSGLSSGSFSYRAQRKACDCFPVSEFCDHFAGLGAALFQSSVSSRSRRKKRPIASILWGRSWQNEVRVCQILKTELSKTAIWRDLHKGSWVLSLPCQLWYPQEQKARSCLFVWERERVYMTRIHNRCNCYA